MKIEFDPDKREATLKDRGLDFADAAEVFDGVTFDFPVGQTYFRIQNNSGATWLDTGNPRLWVKLDLTDYLMPGKSGTGTEGNTLPAPRPLAGSSALSTGNPLPRSLSDFFGTRKPGSRTNTGTIVAGSASQGAFEPV